MSRKIEDALSNLEGIDYLVTKSLPNASIIIANLKYGTNLDKTMQDAQRFIDNIKKDLPKDIQSPVMSKVSPNDLPIMSISVTSDLSASELHTLLTNELLPQIQQIKGVAEITLLGGEEREIQVNVLPDKLKLYKIPLSQVVEAINRSGLDIPAGQVKSNGENNSVRLIGKYKDLQGIKDVQVAMPMPGNPIYVKDLAEVKDGIKEISSVSRFNGKTGIGLLLKKQGDGNAVDVSSAVRKKFKDIEEQSRSENVRFIISDDSTDNTIAAVEGVVEDLLLAVVLVSIIMLLFLRSYRNPLS